MSRAFYVTTSLVAGGGFLGLCSLVANTVAHIHVDRMEKTLKADKANLNAFVPIETWRRRNALVQVWTRPSWDTKINQSGK